MSALLAKRRLKNLLLFIPNMLLLCLRLLTDSRVPATERALVAAAIVYAIVPFDLIPDMIPFVGQIDDAYLIAITLLRLMQRTDPRIVREHWSGGGDVVELVGAAAMLAAKYLPKSIRRVLTSRVEVAPGKKDQDGGLSIPMLVARPEATEAEGSRQEQ
ncbi:MAG TPA: YkvA family protein [Pyrinomonadaceae bacterium]|nr:YkvA family protein [Pyrinomonadaceae bacterium]